MTSVNLNWTYSIELRPYIHLLFKRHLDRFETTKGFIQAIYSFIISQAIEVASVLLRITKEFIFPIREKHHSYYYSENNDEASWKVEGTWQYLLQKRAFYSSNWCLYGGRHPISSSSHFPYSREGLSHIPNKMYQFWCILIPGWNLGGPSQ